MLGVIKKSIEMGEPALFTLTNKKENSPVAAIRYVQCIVNSKAQQCTSSSQESIQVNINITLEVLKQHDQLLAVKKLLLDKYSEIPTTQFPTSATIRLRISASDLKEVVELLGRDYLSDSVFLELGYNQSEIPGKHENTIQNNC